MGLNFMFNTTTADAINTAKPPRRAACDTACDMPTYESILLIIEVFLLKAWHYIQFTRML